MTDDFGRRPTGDTDPNAARNADGAGVDLESAKVSDIHALIAAAKRWGGSAETAPDKARDTLRQHAIAMAEALARIAEFAEQGGMCEPDYPSREAEIARECLDKIMKEWKP